MEILPMSAISAPGKYLVITHVCRQECEQGATDAYFGAAVRLPDDVSAVSQDELDRSIVALERAELLPAAKEDVFDYGGQRAFKNGGRFIVEVRDRGGPRSMNVEVRSFFWLNVVVSSFQCMAQQWVWHAQSLLDEYEAEFHKTQPKFVEQ